jgi:hypothetical protein
MASFARPQPLKGRSTSISIALIAALNDLSDRDPAAAVLAHVGAPPGWAIRRWDDALGAFNASLEAMPGDGPPMALLSVSKA